MKTSSIVRFARAGFTMSGMILRSMTAPRARRSSRRRRDSREMRKTSEANSPSASNRSSDRIASHRDFRPFVRDESNGLEYLLCVASGRRDHECSEMKGRRNISCTRVSSGREDRATRSGFRSRRVNGTKA